MKKHFSFKKLFWIFHKPVSKFPVVILSAAILIIASCTRESIPPPQEQADNDDIPFSLSSAKEFFENNATDIRFVDFSKETTANSEAGSDTRGYIPSDEQIIPIWDKASVFADSVVVIYEIPLDNIGVSGAVILDKSKELIDVSQELEVISYLVMVKPLIKDTTIFFVCTTLGTYDQNDSGDIVSFVKYNPGFTGYLILSDLSGLYLASYMYQNGEGEWADMKSLSKEEIPEEYTGFVFIKDGDSAFVRTRGPMPSNGGTFDEVVVVAPRKSAGVSVDDGWEEYTTGLGQGGSGGGGGGGGGGGSSGGNNNTDIKEEKEQFFYTLTLSATGNGSVSPAGVTSYALNNTSVLISATPANSLTVFSGWFENGTLISNEYRHSITISNNRCIVGTFYLSGDPCGELSTKYRANTRMNNDINNYLRPKINQNNTIEHGYLTSYIGNKEDQTPVGNDRMNVALYGGRKYIELVHSHPNGLLIPSVADLHSLYRITSGGFSNNPNEFMFIISSIDRAISLQIEDITKFEDFIFSLGLQTENGIEKIKKIYTENIVKSEQEMSIQAREDLVIKWLFTSGSGLKITKSELANKENNWKKIKLEDGSILYINCNGQ